MGARSCLLLSEDRGAVCKGQNRSRPAFSRPEALGIRAARGPFRGRSDKRRNFEPIASEVVILLLEAKAKGPDGERGVSLRPGSGEESWRNGGIKYL